MTIGSAGAIIFLEDINFDKIFQNPKMCPFVVAIMDLAVENSCSLRNKGIRGVEKRNRDNTTDKLFRLLQMHERLCRGESIIKSEVLADFEIPAKTFQRDIDSLRSYYSETGGQELVYERKDNCYRLTEPPNQLTKQEVFAGCKILIESRAFNEREFQTIITKLLRQCDVPVRKIVQARIANEQINYLPLQHKKPLFGPAVEALGQHLNAKCGTFFL